MRAFTGFHGLFILPFQWFYEHLNLFLLNYDIINAERSANALSTPELLIQKRETMPQHLHLRAFYAAIRDWFMISWKQSCLACWCPSLSCMTTRWDLVSALVLDHYRRLPSVFSKYVCARSFFIVARVLLFNYNCLIFHSMSTDGLISREVNALRRCHWLEIVVAWTNEAYKRPCFFMAVMTRSESHL